MEILGMVQLNMHYAGCAFEWDTDFSMKPVWIRNNDLFCI